MAGPAKLVAVQFAPTEEPELSELLSTMVLIDLL
jgi:hypothetical protein